MHTSIRLAAALALCAVPNALHAQQGRAVRCKGPRAVPAAIDSAALLADLRALAADSMEGREIGTPGGARARNYLRRRLRQLDLDTLPGGVERPFTSGEGSRRRDGVNLLAVVPGTRADAPVIVLSAHYDHVGIRDGAIHNGADDNASGTAAVLAAGAWLTAHPLRHTVILALLDGEEGGLRGARAFVADPPVPLARLAANVNLDMVSRSPKGELYVVGPAHRPALEPAVRAAACAAPVTLLLGHDKGWSASDDWTTQSDHAAFHEAGIPFLYLGVEDHPDYHRPTDDAERIDVPFYVNAARSVIAILRALDAALP